MRLPTPLLRLNPHLHKNSFGHLLVLAGSSRMLGASCLTSLSAMRSGAGLVTLGIPESLNLIAQKKISSTIMTLPLRETKNKTLSFLSYPQILKQISSYQALAIGPGLSLDPSTQKLILKIIANINIPMVIDADALNALKTNVKILKKIKNEKVLTPHLREMARLINCKKKKIENNKEATAKLFAKQYNCTLLLKDNKTLVASQSEKLYKNSTGNVGMATAGSGDVLTGMIGAFLAQGLNGFDAAKYGALLHGKAGDIASKKKTKICLIATDIIEQIPKAFQFFIKK